LDEATTAANAAFMGDAPHAPPLLGHRPVQ
jgi:hypothetical protein